MRPLFSLLENRRGALANRRLHGREHAAPPQEWPRHRPQSASPRRRRRGNDARKPGNIAAAFEVLDSCKAHRLRARIARRRPLRPSRCAGTAPATWRATLRTREARRRRWRRVPSRAATLMGSPYAAAIWSSIFAWLSVIMRHVGAGNEKYEADASILKRRRAHGLERERPAHERERQREGEALLAARRHNPLAHPTIERCRCSGIDGNRGVAVGLATFNAFGRNQVALGNGVAGTRPPCLPQGAASTSRPSQEHPQHEFPQLDGPLLRRSRRRLPPCRRPRKARRRDAIQIPHGHASHSHPRSTKALNGHAPRHRPAPNRRCSTLDRHWRVARAFDVGGRLR